MRAATILLTEIPPGYKAVRAGRGIDGTMKLVPDSDPVVLQSAYDDLERRFRLLLKAWITTGLPLPAGLESEYAAALRETRTR